jgi:hypothetical protein
MLDKQVFISYSSKNREFAIKLYDDLLKNQYPVWMDKKDLEEVEEWKPQIEDNLRRSNRFIVLISPCSVTSKWVCHEGSMAYALNQKIIPLKIEEFDKNSPMDLPVWVEEKELADFTNWTIEYENRFRRLMQWLGEPLWIQKHLIDMTKLYRNDPNMLLSEVALDLIDKHKDKLEFPEGAKELIEKSRRALKDYWIRYKELEKSYEELEKNYESTKKNLNEFHREFNKLQGSISSLREYINFYKNDIKIQDRYIALLFATVVVCGIAIIWLLLQ